MNSGPHDRRLCYNDSSGEECNLEQIMRRNKYQDIESVGAWGQLAQGRDIEAAARGVTLYAPGQPAGDLLLLRSGQVALYLLSSENRTLTLRVLEPGQLFG